jgi:hypothetical protein
MTTFHHPKYLIYQSYKEVHILGLILFLIYINDLYSYSKLLSIMFADDTACLAKHNNLNELISFVNTELSKVSKCRANRMAVNVNKTKFIIFHTKGKNIDPNITKLTYNDNEPNSNNPDLIYNIEHYHNDHAKPECRSYKLLGIHFDKNLSFDYHTNYLCNKINRSLFCINRAKNFLRPQWALITVYYALIQSHLSYCPTIVSCANTGNILKISKLQKKLFALLTARNLMTTQPRSSSN